MLIFLVVIAKDCGLNEIETDCAPLQSCQRSCNQPNGTACPRICIINSCICKEGFIRYSKNNLTCIEPTQCEKNNSSISFVDH